MARVSGWRVQCPETVKVFQRQVLSGESQLFLMHQTGPTGFVVKEEKKRVALRVHIGDPHSCTCRSYRLNRDLCLHICWTLLRKLRLHCDDPLSFQLGLLPRELSVLLSLEKKVTDVSQPIRKKVCDKVSNEEIATVPRRPITPHVSCPICLEELLERKTPVTHCRHGCGNPVHISCMKILARHQVEHLPAAACGNTMLSCPLCRGDFSTWFQLQEEARNAPNTDFRILRKSATTGQLATVSSGLHAGVTCSSCLTSPVHGRLYRCMQCPHVVLCEACTKDQGTRRLHGAHGLVVREKPGSRWRSVSPTFLEQPPPGVPAVGRRSKVPGTKETLRKCLDDVYQHFTTGDSGVEKDSKCLPASLVAQLPTWKVRGGSKLLLKGQQCCLCLNPYKVKQLVRNLPCGHQFHAKCISHWLINSSATCPLDSADVTHTLMQKALQHCPPPTEGASKPIRRDGSAARGSDAGTRVVPPEMNVRRVCLADRRVRAASAHSSASTSPRPLFLLTTDQAVPNRGYPLPPRPLLGGHRRSSAGIPSPRNRSPSPTEQGYQNEQDSSLFGGHVAGVVAPALSINSLDLRLHDVSPARQRNVSIQRRRGLDVSATGDPRRPDYQPRRGLDVSATGDPRIQDYQQRRGVDVSATGDPRIQDYQQRRGVDVSATGDLRRQDYQPRRGVVPLPRDLVASEDPEPDRRQEYQQRRGTVPIDFQLRRGLIPIPSSLLATGDPAPNYDASGRSDQAALMDIRCLRVRLSERIVANRDRRN